MAVTEAPGTPLDVAARREVPFRMSNRVRVPAERYYDREFFELEKRHLWPRVWQMACREQEIPEPGDFVEYEICDESIIVVRQRDRSVKAFHNVCRHRATQLCKGSGRLAGGQIVCPFHGWRWNLDGSNSLVYGGYDFADECMHPDDIALQECQVDTWGACVWINMDPGARPLREALSPAAELLDNVCVENMRIWWWKEAIVNCNWKMAQEAFMEGYHVMATHPQLTHGAGEDYPTNNVDYKAFENGHARFRAASAGGDDGPDAVAGTTADAFIAAVTDLWQGQDAMTLERDVRIFEGLRHKVPPDQDFASAATAALLDYAQGAGIPLHPTPEGMQLWGGDVFLFPNFFVLPMFGNALSYRARPYGDDPNKCRFEVWSLTMYPEGSEPGRATLDGRFAVDDADNWGLIPRQDFSNMERQQKGVRSASFDGHRLASYMEQAVSNMHFELDRYLDGER